MGTVNFTLLITTVSNLQSVGLISPQVVGRVKRIAADVRLPVISSFSSGYSPVERVRDGNVAS